MPALKCSYDGEPIGVIDAVATKRREISADWAARSMLLDVVGSIVSSDQTGAFVMQLPGNNVRVVDCNVWRTEHTALLTLLRPRVTVTIQGCGDSLSGFEVLIHEATDANEVWLREVCAGCIAALGVGVSVYIALYTTR